MIYKVLIDGHAYEVDKGVVNVMVDTAKDYFMSKSKLLDIFAIVAVEKGTVVEMRKDRYKNLSELNKTIMDYNKRGFKVHYVKKQQNNRKSTNRVLCTILIFFIGLSLSLLQVNAAIKNQLEDVSQITQQSLWFEQEIYKPLGEFTITYYCPCSKCCNKNDGITYSGTQATEGITVAVDPEIIPIGTKIYIEGIGERIAEDTGGAIKGKKIDVYVESHEEALELGKHKSWVSLVDVLIWR